MLASAPAKQGLHAVRLYKDGTMRGVHVDDQIPCHGGRLKPAYSCNTEPRDGPAALIQKALAKVYGCYEHLNNGRVGAALVDLTGGASEKVYLRDGLAGADGTEKQAAVQALDDIESGAMWTRLSAHLTGGALLGATYKAKYESADAGYRQKLAVSDEAAAMRCAWSLVYPVVDFREVEGVQMVKLRNAYSRLPDGQAAPEWRGAWGNTSAEWNNQPGNADQLGGKPRDGAFWMPYADFHAAFNKVRPAARPLHTRRGGVVGRLRGRPLARPTRAPSRGRCTSATCRARTRSAVRARGRRRPRAAASRRGRARAGG
jgi:hypothetical protein